MLTAALSLRDFSHFSHCHHQERVLGAHIPIIQ